mgnify:CR=1 FL=1
MLIIGAGPAGRQVASRLETAGRQVCVIDLSPVNLYSFSQQGFKTIAGDASQIDTLKRARVAEAAIVIVCVSDDSATINITRSVRDVNRRGILLVRCRFHANIAAIQRAGADKVVSEQAVASEALLHILTENIAMKTASN